MERRGIIYKVTCIPTEKIYIGKTIQSLEKRKWRHFWDAKKQRTDCHFYRALRLYGPEAFIWEVLELVSENSLNQKEIEYIQKYNSTDPKKGYNTSQGGELGRMGCTTSEETRKIWSEQRKGRIPWNKGKPMSQEQKEKVSQSLKSYYTLGSLGK